MNIASLFDGIGNELQASKDRVRNLIGDAHWLSDGIWKEKVLISALRRHLPHNVKVGTGFVAGKDGLTKQIDIILYDASRPQLFKDDDFVILTPESVMGIIEVKTKFTPAKYKGELKKIRDNIYLIRSDGKRTPQEGESKIFSGLFYYDGEDFDANCGAELELCCQDDYSVVDLICAGTDFVRFWSFSPDYEVKEYNSWHAYRLGIKSYAYFIMNCIYFLAPYSFIDNDKWWWPEQSKESQLLFPQKSSMTKTRSA